MIVFTAVLMSPNAVTVGIVFSLTLTELITAEIPREIVLVDYETSQLWLTGNMDGAETTLTWGNPNPLPPVTNEVGLSGMYSVDPVKNDSTVSLTPAAPAVP